MKIKAAQLSAEHIGKDIIAVDIDGVEIHAELRQIYHTSTETWINTNPLGYDPYNHGDGATDEWGLPQDSEVLIIQR